MRRHVYYYTYLSGAFEQLSERLAGDPGGWLPTPAQPEEPGWRVELDAGAALEGCPPPRPLLVTLTPARLDEGRLLRGLRWREAAGQVCVPDVDADLELTRLSAGSCKLSLIGTQRPRLTVVGPASGTAGYRLAEACVRRFVLDTAAALEGTAVPV